MKMLHGLHHRHIFYHLYQRVESHQEIEVFPCDFGPQDVMCCLPTGSGKTAIAVFAAWQVLMRGGTVTGDLEQEDAGRNPNHQQLQATV